MKSKSISIRIDCETRDIVERIMEEKGLNQSAAIKYGLVAYGDYQNHVGENIKRAIGWLAAELCTEINEIPQEYKDNLLEIVEEFRCLI